MAMRLARQLGGQGLARRLGRDTGGWGRCCDGRRLGNVRFQLLKAQLELGDLRIELLRGAAEPHPLQLRQLQLHLLDEQIARVKLCGETLHLIVRG